MLKKGVKLNISKLMMIMHYGQLITSEIGKIANGQEDINVKKHIGGVLQFELCLCIFNGL